MNKTIKVLKRTLMLIFIMLMFVGVVVASTSVKAANINIKGVDIIYSNPGEDCSTQVIISWHAKSVQSTLTYTTKNDPNYAYAKVIRVNGVYDETSFYHYDVAKFYKCSVNLTDLEPDTDYIYKIKCEEYTSAQYTFKTAGASEFTFAYMSDIHAIPYDNLELGMTAVKKMQTVQTLLEQAERVTNSNLAFIITTGDEVWRGSQYSNWLEWSKTNLTSAVKDYLWVSCPGNHEYYTQTTNSVWNYYPDKYSSNPSAIYSDPEYFYNTYFNSVKSVPKNGPKGISSCYYTLYNNILFICIDSMQTSDYDHLSEIRAWFEEVVQKNEGKYQYLITYQHYPWYDFVTGEDKYAHRWNDLFDKYGVDLALSGHMHGYLRTKTIYNNKATTDGTGTVYVVSPQIGDRPKVISGNQNERLMAYRSSTKEWPDYSALSAITVNSESLTYKLIDVNGTIRDEFVIEAKRALRISDKNKTAIINSVTMSSSSETVTCDFKASLSLYVQSVELEVGGKKQTVSPVETKAGYVSVNGLENNKLYDAKVKFTFIDGTTYEETVGVVTSNTLGLIDDLRAVSANGKMNVTWNVSDASLVSDYKLYLDDTLYGSSSTNSFQVDLDKVGFDTKYTLEAYKDSKLLFRKDFHYNIYGDVNLDGIVNRTDVSDLLNMILAGKEFDAAAVKLLDNNHDGIVDVGDAYKILAYNSNKVEHIVDNEYDVIFIGFNNETLLKTKVNEGENATSPVAPEVNGYTFVGWSTSYTNVSSDIVVRAIYEAK